MSRNPHIDGFLAKAETRLAVTNREQPCSEWLAAYAVLGGKPFSTARYPFQKAILDDQHPNQAVQKISQVGLTTICMAKGLAFLKRNKGTRVMYTLPNDSLQHDVGVRLKTFADNNAVFDMTNGRKGVRNVEMIQIDDSFLQVLGATVSDATSNPADFLIHDEIDLGDPEILGLFQSRLQNSEFQWTCKFSTPTYRGRGIAKAFSLTDQREYKLRCPACNHWQIPDFTRDFVHLPGLPDDVETLTDIDDGHMPFLDLERACVRCRRCHRPVDLDASDREWVATRPSIRHARGYRVRPFSSARITLPYILRQLLYHKQQESVRHFHNTVLGEPYENANNRLQEVDVAACFSGHAAPLPVDAREPVVFGIDMGLTCHLVVLSPARGVIRFERIGADDLVERVVALAQIYNLAAGAVDRHPYTPTANALREATEDRILPVEYRGKQELHFVKDELGNVTHAQADRTPFLDAAAKAVRTLKIPFSGYGDDGEKKLITAHLCSMVREDGGGKETQPATWEKTDGNDHYFHALGFALFALRINNALLGKMQVDPRTYIGFTGADWVPNHAGILLPTRRLTNGLAH